MKPTKSILPLLWIIPTLLFAQDSIDKISFLPKDRLFDAIIFDPTESQAYGAIVSYWEEDEYSDKVYLPFGMGFYKGFLRWNTDRPYEIGFDFSAHTQFIWTFDDGKSQRNILDSDFKVSMMLNKQVADHHAFRLRFYHVSSHLGDDYIIRNGINSYFPNPNNYEQFDFTWSFQKNNARLYAGLGMVVRPETIRKRFSTQFGGQYERPLQSKWPLGITAGLDVKILEQNDFNPGIKAAIGLRIGQLESNPIRIVAEFYRGNLPYSPFEFKHVQWLGAGLYFMP